MKNIHKLLLIAVSLFSFVFISAQNTAFFKVLSLAL